jgi:hypothetical protein
MLDTPSDRYDRAVWNDAVRFVFEKFKGVVDDQDFREYNAHGMLNDQFVDAYMQCLIVYDHFTLLKKLAQYIVNDGQDGEVYELPWSLTLTAHTSVKLHKLGLELEGLEPNINDALTAENRFDGINVLRQQQERLEKVFGLMADVDRWTQRLPQRKRGDFRAYMPGELQRFVREETAAKTAATAHGNKQYTLDYKPYPDFVLMPVIVGLHWFFCGIDINNRQITIMDSYNNTAFHERWGKLMQTWTSSRTFLETFVPPKLRTRKRDGSGKKRPRTAVDGSVIVRNTRDDAADALQHAGAVERPSLFRVDTVSRDKMHRAVHQNASSLECGFFCCLYAQVWLLCTEEQTASRSADAVAEHPHCTHDYLTRVYKKHVIDTSQYLRGRWREAKGERDTL